MCLLKFRKQNFAPSLLKLHYHCQFPLQIVKVEQLGIEGPLTCQLKTRAALCSAIKMMKWKILGKAHTLYLQTELLHKIKVCAYFSSFCVAIVPPLLSRHSLQFLLFKTVFTLQC